MNPINLKKKNKKPRRNQSDENQPPGAAGAIGQGLAESFAVAGTKLILTYNNTPPPAELKERCLKFGASGVTFTKCNVAQLEGCEELVRQVCIYLCFPVSVPLD